MKGYYRDDDEETKYGLKFFLSLPAIPEGLIYTSVLAVCSNLFSTQTYQNEIAIICSIVIGTLVFFNNKKRIGTINNIFLYILTILSLCFGTLGINKLSMHYDPIKNTKEAGFFSSSETVWFEPRIMRDSINYYKKQSNHLIDSITKLNYKIEGYENKEILNHLNIFKKNDLDNEKSDLKSSIKDEKVIEKIYDDDSNVNNESSKSRKIIQIKNKYGLVGKIDTIISAKYDSIVEAKVNLRLIYLVKLNDKWGAIDSTGKIVVKPRLLERKYAINNYLLLEQMK